MDERLAYDQAVREVRAMRGFYVHFLIFAAVMLLLLAINALTGGVWWVQWPLLGWGIAIIAHRAAVSGAFSWWGADWQARQVRAVMARRNAHLPQR
jgi:hypothetical protein